MIIGRILGVWAQLLSPVHELGHVIFGWLSFNPTIITGWNSAASMRPGFMVQIGGYLFEFIAFTLLVYALRRRWWVYPVSLFSITSVLYSLQAQGDFPGPATGPMLIWWLAGVLSYVLIAYIGCLQLVSEDRAIRHKPSCIQRCS